MTEFLARFGMLICAIVIAWLAKRLHTKAKAGKRISLAVKKSIAVIFMIVSGALLVGTIAGNWMADILGDSGPWIAGALLLAAAGPMLVDWLADGVPDQVALYCSLALGMGLVFGGVQVFDNIQDELNKQKDQVEMQIDGGR